MFGFLVEPAQREQNQSNSCLNYNILKTKFNYFCVEAKYFVERVTKSLQTSQIQDFINAIYNFS